MRPVGFSPLLPRVGPDARPAFAGGRAVCADGDRHRDGICGRGQATEGLGHVVFADRGCFYAKGNDDCANFNQGWRDFNQSWRNFNQGWRNSNQSWRELNQGWGNFNQSCRDLNQTWVNFNQSWGDFNQSCRKGNDARRDRRRQRWFGHRLFRLMVCFPGNCRQGGVIRLVVPTKARAPPGAPGFSGVPGSDGQRRTVFV